MRHLALDARRRLAARGAPPGPYARLLGAALPSPRTRFADVEFLSLDIETTGLDPDRAEILSIGSVLVRNNRIDLGTARSCLVRPEAEVGDSASVHGLTDTLCGTGDELGEVLNEVVEDLAGRVLVVHHAPLDKALLDRACREAYGGALHVPVVDTLALELRRRRRREQTVGPESLRLGNLRTAYHLPYYAGHDALADALATAELLLAMVANSGAADGTTLGEIVTNW